MNPQLTWADLGKIAARRSRVEGMDPGNIGSGELAVILIIAFILVGPRQMVVVAREIRDLLNQLRALVGNLQRQFDLELAQFEGSQRKSAALASGENRSTFELPEAYRRFREDFPEEGLPDESPDGIAHEAGQVGQERRSEVIAGRARADGTSPESGHDSVPTAMDVPHP